MLGTYVRECGALPLEAAIHKMTLAPASRFGMQKLGRIEPGAQADVVIFDAAQVGSEASYTNPEVEPQGIVLVMRAGEVMHQRNGLSVPTGSS
jgi:N-acyl-D-aspartate/D-glutamate deacylase